MTLPSFVWGQQIMIPKSQNMFRPFASCIDFGHKNACLFDDLCGGRVLMVNRLQLFNSHTFNSDVLREVTNNASLVFLPSCTPSLDAGCRDLSSPIHAKQHYTPDGTLDVVSHGG